MGVAQGTAGELRKGGSNPGWSWLVLILRGIKKEADKAPFVVLTA